MHGNIAQETLLLPNSTERKRRQSSATHFFEGGYRKTERNNPHFRGSDVLPRGSGHVPGPSQDQQRAPWRRPTTAHLNCAVWALFPPRCPGWLSIGVCPNLWRPDCGDPFQPDQHLQAPHNRSAAIPHAAAGEPGGDAGQPDGAVVTRPAEVEKFCALREKVSLTIHRKRSANRIRAGNGVHRGIGARPVRHLSSVSLQVL
jgi:hypothetical protein